MTSWYQRLKSGLAKSTGRLVGPIGQILKRGSKLDLESLAALEEALIRADLGPAVAARLVKSLAERCFADDLDEARVRGAMAADIEKILAPVARPFAPDRTRRPHVVLVVGVNGSGKTTTIGKLAERLVREDRRVVLAACDTFRAAAVSQLRIWGERTGAQVIVGAAGADPTGLAFDALGRARAEDADVLLIDTAGRLHNKEHLMAELAKIVRVIRKLDASAPHDVLLVLDATVGQNALAQVETFKSMVNVTGLVVTKLDGSARGGILVAIAERFALPVVAIGVGEGAEDLSSFSAAEFARTLLDVDPQPQVAAEPGR